MRLGIDLGPTDCCIARVDSDLHPTLIADQNDADEFHTPSVVHVFANGALVGRLAEQLLECDPGVPVVRGVSRSWGQTEPVQVDENGDKWYAEGIAALLLKKLRIDAESQASSGMEGVVIAIAAGLGDAQRQSALSACALADVPVYGLIEEPVAVALHYGVVAGTGRETILVWDVGGVSVDVTLLASDPSGIRPLRTGGLRDKGGRKLDEHIGEMILAQFQRALGSPLVKGARSQLELQRASQEIKHELFAPDCTSVRRPVTLGGVVVEVEIALSEVMPVLKGLLDEVAASSEQCLKEAGVAKKDIAKVLLAGGTALIPAVEARARELFPQAKILCREPERAVACGAALHAAHLGAAATTMVLSAELKGVTGYAVGVRTIDAQTGRVGVDTLIRKNMALPAKAQKTYYTTRRRQERLVLDCVQVSDTGEATTSIGHLVVGPLQAERSNHPVELTAVYREDGTVKVVAYDGQSGAESEQVFGGDSNGVVQRLATQRALVRSIVVNGVIA
jgi:molecular chaperone DnaK